MKKKEECRIDDLRMEPAENGIIVCYSEKTKPKSGRSFDNCNYNYKKEVFESTDKAFSRFKELWEEMYEEED